MNASFGDLLRNTTNLSGLQDALDGTAATSFSADVSGVDFDVTFGVLLLPNTTDITPLRGTATGGRATRSPTPTPTSPTASTTRASARSSRTRPTAPSARSRRSPARRSTCAPAASDLGRRRRLRRRRRPGRPLLRQGRHGAAAGALGRRPRRQRHGRADRQGRLPRGRGRRQRRRRTRSQPGTAFGIAKADAVEAGDRRRHQDARDRSRSTRTGRAPAARRRSPDAIGVADLLFHLDDATSTRSATSRRPPASASAPASTGNELASGSVAVNWPTVFEADSCEPDFSTLAVDGRRRLQPEPEGLRPVPVRQRQAHGRRRQRAPSTQGSTNLHDATQELRGERAQRRQPAQPDPPEQDDRRAAARSSRSTANELECTLSGGTRSSDTANANKWKFGDEYEVEGNALALLGIILDNLDKLVEQVDSIDPGPDRARRSRSSASRRRSSSRKIQSIKQTIDELRGSPLAEIDCSQNPDGTNSPGFDLAGLPRQHDRLVPRDLHASSRTRSRGPRRRPSARVGNLTVGRGGSSRAAPPARSSRRSGRTRTARPGRPRAGHGHRQRRRRSD